MKLVTDAFFLWLAQIICFAVAALVFVCGLLKVCHLDLTPAEVFNAVQQVVQTALLFCIVGLLLRPKSTSA